ncbi:hypothetical protein EVAR_72349_1, partial [Eumeta japonica]
MVKKGHESSLASPSEAGVASAADISPSLW